MIDALVRAVAGAVAAHPAAPAARHADQTPIGDPDEDEGYGDDDDDEDGDDDDEDDDEEPMQVAPAPRRRDAAGGPVSCAGSRSRGLLLRRSITIARRGA